GKSTLFNRILGQRLAIVDDAPGVTRDRNFARTEWAGRQFYVVDTGGLDVDDREPMVAATRQQVLAAVEEADVLVFVVDGRTGPHPVDQKVAELLHSAGRPVVLAVNKMDRLPDEVEHHEFWEMGLGEPVPVSAISGRGSGDLLDVIVAHLGDAPPEPEEDALYVAVVGKPNVGKSSLINRLLGEERLVVSEEAGTTRDSIDTPMHYHERTLVFVDTAGLRRQSRIEGLEYYSALRTERALERADVCLLLVDASEPVHVQDLKIAEKVWAAGSGLIIVANKWDLVADKETNTAVHYERHLQERAPSLRWVPVLFTSALTGQRVQKTLDLVLAVAGERERRIATSDVNDVLHELAKRQPPPHYRGRPVRILYATQSEVKPPTFVFFVNMKHGVSENYRRYLHNGIRERWPFTGSPLRLRFRGRKETS
ncbi:MAG TPA: ribosome biogenesis GTPase Der, partial [Longimicrobiales bacterium]|nr:ribosome biogenesis GTPase Der [Longimicrobiales bacterium]